MYKVLLRINLTLIIMFTVLIGIFRYAGQAFAPPQDFSFDPPDCSLPCVFGITPGKTTIIEYRKLIASKVPVAQQTGDGISDFWVEDAFGTKVDFSARYYVTDSTKTLANLVVFGDDGSRITTLGQILSPEHLPVRVFRYRAFGPGGVALVFVLGNEQRIVASAWATGNVNPDTEIDMLAILRDSLATDDIFPDLHMQVDEIRWLGFVSVDKYLNEPIKQ